MGGEQNCSNLLTPEAVRTRCNDVYRLAQDGRTTHFLVRESGLDEAVDRVVDEIQRNYPNGAVPFHSRWRHFEFNGRDLWREIRDRKPFESALAEARSRIDLAFLSVLLDAGAGPEWTYRDAATGIEVGRSEGLALASLRMFESGLLSSAGAADPLRCDAKVLETLPEKAFLDAFQVHQGNDLLGARQRVRLLNSLGRALLNCADVFNVDGQCRAGHLFDFLAGEADSGTIQARQILIQILTHLGGIWPSAKQFGNMTITDAGEYSLLGNGEPFGNIVPFHKLSQWLTYSLIEPIQDGGLNVVELDGLTGLAEYRNGGLFLDCGAIVLKDKAQQEKEHLPDDELIVEWRALTVALLDRVAERVRQRLKLDQISLPLASVLQGGTWSAGRKIAKEMRDGGGPPLRLRSDGTLF